MVSLTPKTAVRAYLILLLLVATVISPLPYSVMALVLLALQLYAVYRPPRAGLNLTIVVGTIILTPLALEPTAGLLSALLVVPALYLLDKNLRENAASQFLGYSKDGRKATAMLKAFATGLLLVFASSLILINQTLILTTAIVIGYLFVVLAYVYRKIPRTPLNESKTWNRIVVGETARSSVSLEGKTGIPQNVSLKTECSWVHVEPSEFTLTAGEKTKLDLSMTPPLAGPSNLKIQALALDPWGLIQTNQTLEPVELHIIPRAKYAEWLAKKYLEQTAPGTAPAAAIPPARSTKATKRGVEFYGSRPYEPGDRLKDVDWKHSYMLDELIVKEFAGAHGQPAILVADLTAMDAEEADKLAYNFVMSALTLATEALPTALAVYNQEKVLATTPPANPREALKKALELTQNITLVEPLKRVLQSTEIPRLMRSIDQLEQVKTESAQKLKEILQLEYQANQKMAKNHPASRTLAKTIECAPPPATITTVSSLSSNEDALSITLQKLKEKGYNIVQVAMK